MFLLRCDIAGCDETVQVEAASQSMLPIGWCQILFSEVDQQKTGLKNIMTGLLAPLSDAGVSFETLAPSLGGSLTAVVQKYACPSHPRPKFKDGEFTPQPQLPLED